MKKDIPKAPAHLTAGTKRWWVKVVSKWLLDDHHIRILQTAAESWDRHQQARRIVAKDGIVILDRFGQKRNHPALETERYYKNLFLRAVRELGLDVTPPDDNRPAAITGRGK